MYAVQKQLGWKYGSWGWDNDNPMSGVIEFFDGENNRGLLIYDHVPSVAEVVIGTVWGTALELLTHLDGKPDYGMRRVIESSLGRVN